MTAPARLRPAGNHRPVTRVPGQGTLSRASPLTSGNHQNLLTRTGDGLVLAAAPQPLAPRTGRGRL